MGLSTMLDLAHGTLEDMQKFAPVKSGTQPLIMAYASFQTQVTTAFCAKQDWSSNQLLSQKLSLSLGQNYRTC